MNTNHECIIGVIYDYEDTRLVTLTELKEIITIRQEFKKRHQHEENWRAITNDFCDAYTLSDYCDKRKSTDLRQFKYCADCGKKIDWKEIKRSE